MAETHPRFLVYTRDDDRRKRLARHLADQADGRIVAIEKPEHVERVSGQYEILGAIIDVNSHDRSVRSIMKAVRSAKWITPPAIVYLYDDTESTIGFMVEERADWLSRRLSNREVVKRLLISAKALEPTGTEGIRRSEVEDHQLHAPEPTLVEQDIETSSSEAIQAMSANLRVDFNLALDAIEAQLNLEPEVDVSAIALSLERSAALLDAQDIGPVTSELLSSSLDDPSEKVLREAILRLRGASQEFPARLPLVAFVGDDDGLVQAASEFLTECLVEHVAAPEELAVLCELKSPDVIVIIDASANTTSRSLQLLRYLRQVKRVPVLVKLQHDRAELGEAQDYGVSEIVAADTTPKALANLVLSAAEESLSERPTALILDVDRTLAPQLIPALDRLGITASIVHKISLLPAASLGVDVILLAAKYRRMSGLDAARSICKQLKMLRPPIVVLAEQSQEFDARRHAFQVGVDDVISLDASTEELTRRTRLLIENYRLRRNAAEHDAITGVHHICGLTRLLAPQIAEQNSKWVSLFMIDVDAFTSIREKYGSQAGRSVLRALADHLSNVMGSRHVFRDWTDRFIVVGRKPCMDDEQLAPVTSNLLDFNKTTFRADDGRGFYVTLTIAHLLVAGDSVTPQSAVDRLVRILNRAKTQSRGSVLSATMDPGTPEGQRSPASEDSDPGDRWEPVVLTPKGD